MKPQSYLQVCLFGILALSFQNTKAQFSTIRNPQFVGVRPMGMGETGVGLASDFNTIYWNPAGLPFVERYEVQFMHANLYQTGIKDNYLAFMLPALPFLRDPENLAFGFGWQNLSFGDDELDFAQHKFIFSTGYRLSKYLALGANLKYFYRSILSDGEINEGEGNAWGFDGGVLISPVKGLRIGLMAHDVTTTKMRYDVGSREDTLFVRNIRYGAAYEFKEFLFFKNPLLAVDVDDRLHVGGEVWLQNLLALRVGWQKDLHKNGEEQATLAFGIGLRHKLFAGTALQLDYAYTDSPFLQNTGRFSASLAFSLKSSPVKIENIRVQQRDIFIAQYKYHEATPWLQVDLSYNGDKPIEGKLLVSEKKFGIKAEQSFKFDNPRTEKTKNLEIKPTLSTKLLSKSVVSQRDSTFAVVSVETKSVIQTRPENKESPKFMVYGRGNIDWSLGAAQAAAFILPEDALVKQMADKAQQLYNEQPDAIIVNRNISLAALLFQLVGQYGIRNQKDANLPRGLDAIKDPFELLRTKWGDCDDTTILFASLLESLGIHTALITTSEHIWLMFDANIPANHHLQLCLPRNLYVIYKGRVWIPVETTIYGEEFETAWREGVKRFNAFQSANRLEEVVEVAEARQKYEEYQPSYPAFKLDLPADANLRPAYRAELARNQQAQEQYLHQNYYLPLQHNPDDLQKLDELKTIMDLTGRKDEYQKLQKRIDVLLAPLLVVR